MLTVFSGCGQTSFFLLYMIVALKQGKLAINKSGLEIRIFFFVMVEF